MVKLIRKDKKKKGFTLIELVAVVAIIGILAAILVPKIAGYMNEAKKTKVIDQARKVILAVETYNMKNDSKFPGETVNEVEKNATCRNFIDPDETSTTEIKILDKLPNGMTIDDCKKIVEERKDFKLSTSDGFGGLLATS